MRTATQSTKAALANAVQRWRSLDGVTTFCDVKVSKGTLGRILTDGSVSLKSENAVRAGLGLHPTIAEVETCPTCGEVHIATADCGTPPPPARVPRKRPERRSLNVRRETWEVLNVIRLHDQLTWDLLMVDMARAYMELCHGSTTP
jgi:hypothetical protein